NGAGADDEVQQQATGDQGFDQQLAVVGSVNQDVASAGDISASADEWNSASSLMRHELGDDGAFDEGSDGSEGDGGGHFSGPFGIGGGEPMYNGCMALQMASSRASPEMLGDQDSGAASTRPG
ncbi:unnamed protein product, partial [Ectocarpus fasciculatus]